MSSRWREKAHRTLVNDQTLAYLIIFREILQWPHLDEDKRDIRSSSMIKKGIVFILTTIHQWSHLDQEKNHFGRWSMIKYWRMFWWWERFFNAVISMKTKNTSDVPQWSNIGKPHHFLKNSTIISTRSTEKANRMLANDQTFPNVLIFTEILQWFQLDEEKKGHRILVHDQTLPNMFVVRENLQWSNSNEEEKHNGSSSTIKHSWTCSSSEKFINDLISINRNRTSVVRQWPNSGECVYLEWNCSMISSR